MHATGFIRGYTSTTCYDLRMAQLNNRNDFSTRFLCRKVIPCFLVYPPHPCYKSDKKRTSNREPVSVCALTRTYTTWTSTHYVDVPDLPPSRPGTQAFVMLLCGFFWRSNRNHYLLVRALATSIHVRTYLPKFNMKCTTTMIPTVVPWGFLYSNNIIILFVLAQNTTPIWK